MGCRLSYPSQMWVGWVIFAGQLRFIWPAINPYMVHVGLCRSTLTQSVKFIWLAWSASQIMPPDIKISVADEANNPSPLNDTIIRNMNWSLILMVRGGGSYLVLSRIWTWVVTFPHPMSTSLTSLKGINLEFVLLWTAHLPLFVLRLQNSIITPISRLKMTFYLPSVSLPGRTTITYSERRKRSTSYEWVSLSGQFEWSGCWILKDQLPQMYSGYHWDGPELE